MFGLGLDVAVILLLLGGTLYGLASYKFTVKSIESKVAELQTAEAIKDALKALKGSPRLTEEVGKVQRLLASYEDKLADTVRHGRDHDRGYHEQEVAKKLHEKLTQLDKLAAE